MVSTMPWSNSPSSTFVLHSPQAPARQLLASAYPARSSAPRIVSPGWASTTAPEGASLICDDDGVDGMATPGEGSEGSLGFQRGDGGWSQKTGMMSSRSTSLTSSPEIPTSGIAGNGMSYWSSTPLRLRMAPRQFSFLVS